MPPLYGVRYHVRLCCRSLPRGGVRIPEPEDCCLRLALDRGPGGPTLPGLRAELLLRGVRPYDVIHCVIRREVLAIVCGLEPGRWSILRVSARFPGCRAGLDCHWRPVPAIRQLEKHEGCVLLTRRLVVHPDEYRRDDRSDGPVRPCQQCQFRPHLDVVCPALRLVEPAAGDPSGHWSGPRPAAEPPPDDDERVDPVESPPLAPLDREEPRPDLDPAPLGRCDYDEGLLARPLPPPDEG